MKTPKEKAEELVKIYIEFTKEWDELDGWVENKYNSKQCALIAVDEILEMDLPILEEDADTFYDYWEEVKHEIKKL